MSKLLIFIIVAAIAALVWTGIVEVNVNSDKVGDLPDAVVSGSTKAPLFEKARSFTVQGTRKAELFFAEKDDQKMEVILGFVEKDSKRLQEMMEVGRTASEVKPQAELLVESLRQARVQSWELSEGELADLASDAQNVMNAAVSVFNAIDTYYEEDAIEELASVTTALEEELETAIAQEKTDESQGAVAGDTNDTRDEEPEADEDASIPLKF